MANGVGVISEADLAVGGTINLKLKKDLSGWEEKKVRGRVVVKFGKQDLIVVKEKFEVKDAPGSAIAGVSNDIVRIANKEILPDKTGVMFDVSVNAAKYAEIKEPGQIDLQIEVELDMSAMVKSAISISMAAAGMGWLGSAAGQGVNASVNMVAGKCRLQLQLPIFKLSVRKLGWQPIENIDLFNVTDNPLISREELADLYKKGGILRVPVLADEQVTSSLAISEKHNIFDCEGVLQWGDQQITGRMGHPDSEDDKYIVFEISGQGDFGVDVPVGDSPYAKV